MKKGIILYRSKYGAAKRYAEWLTELTGFDCAELPNVALNDVKEYETILLCGGIYASGVAGISFLKKNLEALKNQKIAVFCVGASPYDAKALDELKAFNTKGKMNNIPFFYGRGFWNESKMSLKDRILCRALKKAVAKRDPSTYEPWMKALMSAGEGNCDWTDRKYLEPILDYLKEQ